MAAALLVAAPAAAVPTCAFDGPTATITVAVGNGETATIARTGEAITLDAVPCGAATVSTTDAIVVNATGIPAAVVIDLSGGDFAPGLTTESDGGNSEIEFSIDLPAGSPIVRIAGGTTGDNIVAGAAGLNLNAVEAVGDADVLIVGLPALVVGGGAGNDVLSVTGGSGTGAPSTARLEGGTEGDLLIGASGGNALTGGDGSDTVDYTAATQLLDANLITGVIQHVAGLVDQVTDIENLTGSPGADAILGDGDDNVLRGGDGPDTLSGGAGNDTLDGGSDVDTVDFGLSDAGVEVSLGKGTATGAGEDTLIDVENVIGSDKADTLNGEEGINTLDGGDGSDVLNGRGGGDELQGGDGRDSLFGQKGRDDLSAGAGNDRLDGGKGKNDVCQGGTGADSFVFCEVIKLG